MSVIQIVGNQSGAGKTSLAAALLVTAANVGRRAAYYKPFADGRTTDADVTANSALLAYAACRC